MEDDVNQIDDWQEDGVNDAPAPVVAAAVIPAEAPAPVVPPVAANAVPAEPEPDGTLEEHEAAEETARAERDPRGRFAKGRDRASSQKASPADVPLISEYTKRIKAAEAAAGTDIVQQPGESNRVYELRRRAELAERRAAAAEPAKPQAVAEPAPAPRPSVSAPVGTLYPVKAAKDDPEPDPTKYDDLTKYLRDQSLWSGRETLRQANAEIEQQHQAARQHEGALRSFETYRTSMHEAAAKFPDFRQVVEHGFVVPGLPHITEIPQQSVIDDFVRTRPGGGTVLYHLKKNPAEFARIWNMPDGIEQFAALTLLVDKLTAAPSKPAVVAQPVTQPPRTIRTTPTPVPPAEPSDDESLEDFEKRYETRRRR